ncbi:MAG: class IV adenylate cyclase [Deltaproteobacteria bacterium]|nr:class IV adenylate cyclase [Deltaproteobacteria bacterium]
MSGPLETEIKFHILNKNSIRKRALSIGAVSEGRHEEYNLRLDDSRQSLLRGDRLLRLRRADTTTLTLKSPAPEKSTDFKVHEELEVCMDDFDTMATIFNALGFTRVQVYEKIRETFKLGNTILCLDEMPFGTFLEIEGTCNAIVKTAGQLGFSWEDRIIDNYLSMFETIRRILGLKFSDLTFENFSDIHIDFAEYLHLFVAGPS